MGLALPRSLLPIFPANRMQLQFSRRRRFGLVDLHRRRENPPDEPRGDRLACAGEESYGEPDAGLAIISSARMAVRADFYLIARIRATIEAHSHLSSATASEALVAESSIALPPISAGGVHAAVRIHAYKTGHIRSPSVPKMHQANVSCTHRAG